MVSVKMVNFLEISYKKYRNFILYVIIGVWGLVIDLGLYFFLFNVLGVSPVISNVISSGISILNNFVLNAIFNFKKSDRFYRRMFTYFGINTIGILISSVLISILVSIVGINGNIAKLITVIIVNISQYIFNKKITFK